MRCRFARTAIDAINQGHGFRYLTEPWEPEELEAVVRTRVLGVDWARSAGVAAQRRPGDRIMHASLRHGLTHRGEDPAAARRHGAPHRVRLRGDRLSPMAAGNEPRYHEAWSGCP